MGVVRRGRTVRWERVARQLTWKSCKVFQRTLKHRKAPTILAHTLSLPLSLSLSLSPQIYNIYLTFSLALLYLDVVAGLVHLAVAPWGEGIRGEVGISLEGASSIPSQDEVAKNTCRKQQSDFKTILHSANVLLISVTAFQVYMSFVLTEQFPLILKQVELNGFNSSHYTLGKYWGRTLHLLVCPLAAPAPLEVGVVPSSGRGQWVEYLLW